MYMYSAKTQYLSSFYFLMLYTIYNLLLTFNVCSNNHSWCPPNFKSIYIYLTLLLSYGNKHVCKMAIVLSYAVSLQKFYCENSN